MSSFGKLLLGAVMGAAAGWVYGVLSAPRPGHETRRILEENLREQWDESSTCVKEKLNTVSSRLDGVAETVAQQAEVLKTRAVALASELETTGRSTLEHLKN